MVAMHLSVSGTHPHDVIYRQTSSKICGLLILTEPNISIL